MAPTYPVSLPAEGHPHLRPSSPLLLGAPTASSGRWPSAPRREMSVTMNCAVPVLRLRRARLVLVGTRVFGDEAKAREWARTAQPALGGAIPDELVDTLDGLERALSELASLQVERGT